MMINENKLVKITTLDSNKKIDLNCGGCGKRNPKYYNETYDLFVCGSARCKPYEIMCDWAYHAVTGR